MKKIITLITILIILSTIHCVAIDSSIWYKFPIPEYSYSQAYIYVPDLFRWEIRGDDSIINLKAGGYYNYFIQRSDFDVWCNSAIRGEWYKSENGSSNQSYERKEISYQSNFGATRYFNKFNIWSEGNFIINARNEYKCRTELDIEIGGGLGRIVSCTPVAKAVRLIKELNIKADENLILNIADTIAKRSTYQIKCKDTWEEIFYQKIADMLCLPDQGLKIRRILSSSIYETVSRSRGWEVKLGYGNNFFTGIDPHPKGYILFNAEYRLPWGLNKQINLKSEYSRSLDDDSSVLEFEAVLRIEHNYTWASFIEIELDKTFNSPEINDDTNYSIWIGTEKNIFNRLVSRLIVSYTKSYYYNDPIFGMFLELRYYIW